MEYNYVLWIETLYTIFTYRDLSTLLKRIYSSRSQQLRFVQLWKRETVEAVFLFMLFLVRIYENGSHAQLFYENVGCSLASFSRLDDTCSICTMGDHEYLLGKCSNLASNFVLLTTLLFFMKFPALLNHK